MKKVLFFLFTLVVSVGLFAQQQPVVAVAPFNAISGITETDANMITRVFFIRLGNTNKVSLVDRNIVDRVLREHSFQAGDWSNQEKTAELGKALNTDWIVRGELETFGTNILVTVQFYDIQTFRFMGGAYLLLDNAAEALEKMDPLVDKLVETIASSSSQPRQSAQQDENAGAPAFYGTWVYYLSSNSTYTLTIDANKITFRSSANGNYLVVANCTWTAENNNDIKTLTDYPKGFKVSGVVSENKGETPRAWMPLYLFIHKSDSNKMYWYYTPDSNSEVQLGGHGPFGKLQ